MLTKNLAKEVQTKLNACQKWSPLMTGATSKCICGVQPPENNLTTIFVCYFLHVRSSVYCGNFVLGV